MKKIFICCICLLVTLLSNSNAQTIGCGYYDVTVQLVNENICDERPLCLLFEDNFNSSYLDLSSWKYGPRTRYCNNEIQYYTSGNNIKFENGKLVIFPKEEVIWAKADDYFQAGETLYCASNPVGVNYREFEYTSGNIETIKKFGYGLYEASIQIPKGKGYWPAFWLWGNNPVYNEIDIFEFMTEDNLDSELLAKRHLMTMHFDHDGDGNKDFCATNYIGEDYSDGFHTYSLLYEPDRIIWFVDGIQRRIDHSYYLINGQEFDACNLYSYAQYIKPRVYAKHPMQIILNFAIEGNSKKPDDISYFKSNLIIDWVRYYGHFNCNLGGIIVNGNDPVFELNEQFQSILGSSVVIQDNNVLNDGEQLNIIAKEDILIKPGIDLLFGSSFCASIINFSCPSSNRNEINERVIQNDNSSINILSPNPTTGIININNKYITEITVTNLYGQIMEPFIISRGEHITMDITNFETGVYIVKTVIEPGKIISYHKIVKL